MSKYQLKFEQVSNNAEVDRQSQAKLLLEALNESGINSQLTNPESRHNFMCSLAKDDFVELLEGMARVVMNSEPEENMITRHGNVIWDDGGEKTIDIMPSPEDKVELLGWLLDSASKLEDPELQATLIGFGINLVHPFADGNGRVARATYLLLTGNSVANPDEFIKALGKNGDNEVMLDPNLFKSAGYQLLRSKIGSHEADEDSFLNIPVVIPVVENLDTLKTYLEFPKRDDVDHEYLNFLATIFADENVGSILTYLLVMTNPIIVSAAQSIVEFGPQKFGFRFDKYLKTATSEDLEKTHLIFRGIKREYIQTLFSTFTGEEFANALIANPNEPEKYSSFIECARYITNNSLGK